MHRLLGKARGDAAAQTAGPDLGVATEPPPDTSYPTYGEVRAMPQRHLSRREPRHDKVVQLITRSRKHEPDAEPSERRRARVLFPFRKRALLSDDDAHGPAGEVWSASLPPAPDAAENDADQAAQHVSNFCRAAPTDDDWDAVHELGDWLNASDARSRAAMRALKHELKSYDLNHQCRSVRAWCVWTMLGGGHFSTYADQASYLAALEEQLDNTLTHPQLRSDILLVVGALAHRAQHMERLHKIARLWARARPPSEPERGAPLHGPLFRDHAQSPRGEGVLTEPMDWSAPQMTEPMSWPAEPRAEPMPWPTAAPAAPRSWPAATTPWPHDTSERRGAPAPPAAASYDTPSAVPVRMYTEADEEDEARLASVRRDCDAAHTNAAMLLQALTVDDMASARIALCRDKVAESHVGLEAHLAWASVRTEVVDPHAQRAAEQVVNMIVTALARLGEALTICDEARREWQAPASAPSAPPVPMDDDAAPAQPSAKALGKRRAVDEPGARPALPTPPVGAWRG